MGGSPQETGGHVGDCGPPPSTPTPPSSALPPPPLAPPPPPHPTSLLAPSAAFRRRIVRPRGHGHTYLAAAVGVACGLRRPPTTHFRPPVASWPRPPAGGGFAPGLGGWGVGCCGDGRRLAVVLVGGGCTSGGSVLPLPTPAPPWSRLAPRHRRPSLLYLPLTAWCPPICFSFFSPFFLPARRLVFPVSSRPSSGFSRSAQRDLFSSLPSPTTCPPHTLRSRCW